MRLSYRSSENTLRLSLDEEQREVAGRHELSGYVDVAEQGRLIGVELAGDGVDLPAMFSIWLRDRIASGYVQLDGDTAYIALSTPREDIPALNARTAEVHLLAELDSESRLVALVIPRRGHGYEISFPSGNR